MRTRWLFSINFKIILFYISAFFEITSGCISYAGTQASHVALKAKIDSLENLLTEAGHDTVKMLLLLHLEKYYSSIDPEKAIYCNQQVISLARKNRNQIRMAEAMNNMGVIWTDKGDYQKSLKYLRGALSIYNKTGNRPKMAGSLGNIGINYTYMGDYENGLKNLLECQKIMEELNDKPGLMMLYVSTGAIYYYMGNYDYAISHYEKSLALAMELNDKLNSARAYNNIGLVYSKKPDYEKALEFYYKAISMTDIPDIFLLINLYNNIGIALKKTGKTYEALDYYQKALSLAEEYSYISNIASGLTNLAILYSDLGNHSKAIEYLNRSIEISKKAGRSDYLYRTHFALADVYYKVNDIKNMYSNITRYIEIKDSILNDKTTKQIAEMQTRFETEKKEKEITLLQKDKQLNTVELKRQRIITFSISAGLLLVIISGLILMNRFLVIRRQKAVIAGQKIQVEKQKEVIEEKNRNITDSIEYAQIIQNAILPSNDDVNRIFGEYFIFHRQKDIIGGDFYFITEVNGWKIIALADCTGHGVPGALMSMLGKDMLNEIVNDKKVANAGEVLDILSERITDALNPDKNARVTVRDGMDVCLIALCGNDVQFAGAKRPLITCCNGVLNECPPDDRSIGGERGVVRRFSTHRLHAERETMLYLFTDGFADQFGGPKNKKYKTENLKHLFTGISGEPLIVQKQVIEKTFLEWKGENEQTDDVTVIGIRV